MANSIESVFNRYRYDIGAARKSRSWFDQQTNLLRSKAVPSRIIQQNSALMKPTIVPGNLYLFMYDALNKDTLPYWDMFPLVFPYRRTGNTFFGLNFHYMPPVLRVKILEKLYGFRTNDKMDGTTRLKLSWQLISSASTYHPLANCVKQYRFDQVQTRFLKIEPKDWVTAMMLPSERFVGSTRDKIWTETRNKR